MSTLTGVGARRETDSSEGATLDAPRAIPSPGSAAVPQQARPAEKTATQAVREEANRLERAEARDNEPFFSPVGRRVEEHFAKEFAVYAPGTKSEMQLEAKISGKVIGGGGRSGVTVERTEDGYRVTTRSSALLEGEAGPLGVKMGAGAAVVKEFGTAEGAADYVSALLQASARTAALGTAASTPVLALTDNNAELRAVDPRHVTGGEISLSQSAAVELQNLNGHADLELGGSMVASFDAKTRTLVVDQEFVLSGKLGLNQKLGWGDLKLESGITGAAFGVEGKAVIRREFNLSDRDIADLKSGNHLGIIARHAGDDAKVVLSISGEVDALEDSARFDATKEIGLVDFLNRATSGTLVTLPFEGGWKTQLTHIERAPWDAGFEAERVAAKLSCRKSVPVGAETTGTLSEAAVGAYEYARQQSRHHPRALSAIHRVISD
ncbi:MAG: hypothetical protein WBV82_20460 [Myxococcaceae bacterium]